MKPVKIIQMIARLNIGGPAVIAVSLSAGFSRDPYQTLLVCGKVGAHEGDMGYLAAENGVAPHILPGLGREISPLKDTGSFFALRRLIKDYDPRIIHTHTAKAGTLGRLAAVSLNLFRRRKHRIRLVHTFHGHIFHSYFGPLKTFAFILIERCLAKFTDKIIVISPRQKMDICERFRIADPEKVRIIPLGFDFSGYGNPENDKDRISIERFREPSRERLRVGIVGRLTAVKNHRMFLEAVRHLKNREEAHHFMFNVVGDGELRDELVQYAESLGVGESVRFVGWRRDMPSVYRDMDILVLTSLNEGTPVTLIEAMAAGRPVVATDVGGVSDLLGVVDKKSDDGYKLAQRGILIPSGKSESLANALEFIEKNRGLAGVVAERARGFAFSNYSGDRLIKDIASLYDALVGEQEP